MVFLSIRIERELQLYSSPLLALITCELTEGSFSKGWNLKSPSSAEKEKKKRNLATAVLPLVLEWFWVSLDQNRPIFY